MWSSLLLALMGQVSLAQIAASCHKPAIVARIIGGTAASVREFPFLAEVRTATSLCGGSLIAPGWVLTAAHCGNSEYVVMGKYNLDTTNDPCEERINVRAWYPHPQYNAEKHTNDIQLLQLDGASSYPPIKLWDGAGSVGAVGSTLTVAGWGTLSQDSQTASNVLMKVNVPVQSNAKCLTQYPGVINDQMLCAGLDAGGKDSCTGDSGGPLFGNDASGFVQVGLVSFGKGCGQAAAYGVYTRVSSYRDWICRTSGVCGPVVPTPAPVSAPTRGTTPTQPPSSRPNQPTSRPNCRTCIYCISNLPFCPRPTPAPAPTPQPTPQPTPAPPPANNNNGGGLFGGNLGAFLGLQMLLNNNNNNNNNGKGGKRNNNNNRGRNNNRNPWDNNPWDNDRHDDDDWNNNWNNNNGFPSAPYQPWSPPTPPAWGSPWNSPPTPAWNTPYVPSTPWAASTPASPWSSSTTTTTSAWPASPSTTTWGSSSVGTPYNTWPSSSSGLLGTGLLG